MCRWCVRPADSSTGLQVNLMTSFNSASFPDSLAIAKESGLTIGSIDEIQKLHIRAVPMGEQARRLAHQDSSHTFLVTTSSEPSGSFCHPIPTEKLTLWHNPSYTHKAKKGTCMSCMSLSIT